MDEPSLGFLLEGRKHRPYVIRPWVGSEYHSSKLRIIAHGVSYYATEGDNSWEAWCSAAERGELENETSGQIRWVISHADTGGLDENGKKRLPTRMYTSVVQAIAGKTQIDAADVKNVLGGIAFNNYVHVPMRSRRAVPTSEHYRIAHSVYIRELTEVLKWPPHLSLVFAKRIWDHLRGGRRLQTVKVDGAEREVWLYEFPCGPVVVGWLKHPASYNRPNGWRDDVDIPFAQAYIRAAEALHGLS